jgi:2-oxoglutarate ferredoxin oxidoreductase subunit delta
MAETGKKTKAPPRIDIYKAWCKGCGLCAAFCPAGVLARDEAGYPYIKEPEKCRNCGWCEMHCPDFAITVQGKKKGDINPGEAFEKKGQAGTAAAGQ